MFRSPGGSKPLDPFTAEIVREGLLAIAEEMFASLGRTSKSPIIYEVLDYACALTTARAELIGQANGVTGFLGTLTYAVQDILDKFGDDMAPGDIFATNDPYGGGGSHLSDVSMVMPIFVDGHLVAFAVNKAHWSEIGGKDAGSWTTDATEIYQEGLQLPGVRLFRQGRPEQGILDIIAANVRTPDMTLGDLHAQAACLRLAGVRMQELCAKYGIDTVHQAIEQLLNHGEQLARQGLARLPKGVFEAEDFIDDDGLGHEPRPVRVRVTITDDEFIADFTGTAPQSRGPVNCSRVALMSGVRAIFLALTNPNVPANEGCFRPLRVICPDGTVLTAQRPAPVSTHWEARLFSTEIVWKALAPAVPERLTAGHYLSVCAEVVVSTRPETGELAILVEPNAGGWGAGFDKDGEDGLYCVGDGETYVLPAEVAEASYSVRVNRYAFDIVDAGEGRFRGGRGMVREYVVTSEEGATVTASFGRHRFRPWGVQGGRDGSPNYVQVVRADGREEPPAGKLARAYLAKGDMLRLVTGTGGGWGDPRLRPREKVLADLRAGMITVQAARDVYGLTEEELAGVEEATPGGR
ncbi:MAG: hydantoinase B/oxoprolinase family protein [Firmicutes bacterium]|nr:hydantoinase B/oxoprolinase family protein [Bacillota bacterium]